MKYNDTVLKYNYTVWKYNATMWKYSDTVLKYNDTVLKYNDTVWKYIDTLSKYNATMWKYNDTVWKYRDNRLKIKWQRGNSYKNKFGNLVCYSDIFYIVCLFFVHPYKYDNLNIKLSCTKLLLIRVIRDKYIFIYITVTTLKGTRTSMY